MLFHRLRDTARDGAAPLIENNTIVGAQDCGIYAFGASPTCRNNVLADCSVFGIACFGPPYPTIDCNVLWNNGPLQQQSPPQYSPDCTPGALDQIVDPLFCGEVDYRVQENSPCLAANNEGCGDVGAITDTCLLDEGEQKVERAEAVGRPRIHR